MQPSTKQPPWQRLSRMSAILFGLLLAYACYRYNADFGIGGPAFLQGWPVTTDMILYLGAPLAVTMLLNRFAPIRTNRLWITALVLQAVTVYILADLHYWRFPAPGLEASYSDLWARLLD